MRAIELQPMVDSLTHRGPDGSGVWCEGAIGLGHRRLAVFDLSNAGSQPMLSADRRHVIVHNGEVYNWPEIRKQLKCKNWRSQTDTETILQAYVELGEDCLSLFNGMFAFAIWDRHNRTLFLARDRVGIKPLYYGWHHGDFYFASEMKAFFAGGFPRNSNLVTIYDFLRWGVIDHAEETFFEGIVSLKPGHSMLIKSNEVANESCYWDLMQIVRGQSQIGIPEVVNEYSALVQDAIDLRLRSDVPVGVFLSGGIDSSILAARLAQNAQGRRLVSFTYEFDTGQAGEGQNAKEIADLLGLENQIATLGHAEIPDYFNKALYHQELPVTSIRCLAAQKLYEKVLQHEITVVLEGLGGDQLGGGFEYYFVPHVMDVAFHQGPNSAYVLMNEFMELYHVPENKRARKLFDCFAAFLTPGTATQDGVNFVKPHCLSSEFLDTYGAKQVEYPRPFSSNLLNTQYIDFCHNNLPRTLRYKDRESMASGREARVPFLDHRLVELCFRSSPAARIDGIQQRNFMRQAAREFLPEEVLFRPKKSIVDPQRRWLQNELREWVCDTFHSDSFRGAGIFNVDEVLHEYRRFCSEETPRTSFHIFQYLNVALWLQMENSHGV